jgi:hypothetical protein
LRVAKPPGTEKELTMQVNNPTSDDVYDTVSPVTYIEQRLRLHAKHLLWGEKAGDVLDAEEMGLLAVGLYDLAEYVSRNFRREGQT